MKHLLFSVLLVGLIGCNKKEEQRPTASAPSILGKWAFVRQVDSYVYKNGSALVSNVANTKPGDLVMEYTEEGMVLYRNNFGNSTSPDKEYTLTGSTLYQAFPGGFSPTFAGVRTLTGDSLVLVEAHEVTSPAATITFIQSFVRWK